MADAPECELCGAEATTTLGSGGVCQDCYDEVSGGNRPTKASSGDETPGVDIGEPASSDLYTPEIEENVFPEALKQWPSWTSWVGIETDGGVRKQPYAPWGDADHPEKPEDVDARYSWSLPANWADFATVEDWVRKDPQLETPGFVFQKPADPYADEADPFFAVDYDDCRDPETGEIHPIVAEHLERAGTYADVSTSGTGVHIDGVGTLPDGARSIQADLPDHPRFPDAEIEVYDGKRFMAMTGEHIVGTPDDLTDCQAFLEELADEFDTVAESSNPGIVREPEKSRAELEDVSTTEEIQDVFDAIHHTRPGDIWLHSEATNQRANGDLDLDPSWTTSDSGTRLGQVGDDWIYREGSIGLDALQVVALEEGIIADEDEYPRGEAFWRAVETLRERGAHIPEYENPEGDEASPVNALPLARQRGLSADEARRYARRQGIEWPTTHKARRRLRDTIMRAMRAGQSVVVDAPTALGKSHTVATEPWLNHADHTGEQPVIHLHETREARDSVVEKSREAGSTAVLLGRNEACPVAGGGHDPDADGNVNEVVTVEGMPASEWFATMCEGRGVPFSVAHTYLEEHNDQGLDDLPCSPGDAECPAIAQWNGLPRTEDGDPAVDVIHATHNFAHVPGLRTGTNLVFDERPDFTVELSQDRVRRAVTAYLREVDADLSSFELLIQVGKNGLSPNEHDPRSLSQRYDDLRDQLDVEPDREWYLENADAHTLAPALARGIFAAKEQGNGRYAATVPHDPPRLDANAGDDEGWNRERVTVVFDDENTIRRIRASPDLATARSVIGLDAHPTDILWQRNVHPAIETEALLESEERRLWRYFERGLAVIQVGDATRPFSSGEYFDEQGTRAVIEHLREQFGDDFATAITASSVEGRTRGILQDAGVDDPTIMHFGEEKSRNDFADEVVGLVNGCIDPGDDYVLDLLAEAGLDAVPETRETDDGEQYRAHGRGFVGDDADVAAALLASVREQHVAQAAGRYARNAEDPNDRAMVFVRTDAMPVGFADLQVPGVEWLASEHQRDIVRELRSREYATAAELAESVGVSKEHVRTTLALLLEEGAVDVRSAAGDFGADVYRALTGAKTAETGLVDLTSDEIANDAVWGLYTWSLAIAEPGTLVEAVGGVSDPADLWIDADGAPGQATITGYPPG